MSYRIVSNSRITPRSYTNSYCPTGTAKRCRRTGVTTNFSSGSTFSMAFWLKSIPYARLSSVLSILFMESCSSTSSNFRITWSQGTTANQRCFKLYSTNDAGSILINAQIASANFYDLNWHHFVLVYNNTTWLSYIDGEYYTTGATNRAGAFTFDKASIAIESVNNWNEFGGNIKEFIVTSTALSASNVKNLYYGGIIPSSLLLYLKFDEGSGTNCADSSGNSANFTLATATGAWSTDVPLSKRSSASSRTALARNARSSI